MTTKKEKGDLGIKKMGTMNLALMAKLWAKVINSKYMKGEASIPKLVQKNQASNTWRGIISAANIVQQEAGMSIGNGKNSFFWREKWLGTRPLIEVVVREVPMIMSYCMVNDYWDKERGWKWDLINEILPHHILNWMATVLIREEEDVVDEIDWEPSNTGRFTMKSTYAVADPINKVKRGIIILKGTL